MSALAKLLVGDIEVAVLKVAITRGLRAIRAGQKQDGTASTRTQELHVSDFTKSEKAFCYRRLLRRYWEGEGDRVDVMTPVQFDGKFREEKWRLIFEAAGVLREYQPGLRIGPLTGHPDFIVDLGHGPRVVELTGHDSRIHFKLLAARTAQKKRQCLMYTIMRKYPVGYVIIEDKSSQETRVLMVRHDAEGGSMLFGRVAQMKSLVKTTRLMSEKQRGKFIGGLPPCDAKACRECHPKEAR